MKFILVLLLLATTALADDSNLPRTITYKNGKTFEVAEYLKWGKDRVTVRYVTGQTAPVFFHHLKKEDGDTLRDYSTNQSQRKINRDNESESIDSVTGQVFVTTRGAQAYRFTGAEVELYRARDLKPIVEQAVASAKFRLGSGVTPSDSEYATEIKKKIEYIRHTRLANTRTDADGSFTMKIPDDAGEVMVYCHATRLTGRIVESNTWAVPVGSGEIHLGNFNQVGAE